MMVLGQDKVIRDRIGKLQEMHAIITGQIGDLEVELEDKRAQRARIEGGIIELQALLNQPKPEETSEEKGDEEE